MVRAGSLGSPGGENRLLRPPKTTKQRGRASRKKSQTRNRSSRRTRDAIHASFVSRKSSSLKHASRYKSSILIGAILPARRLSLFAARHPISRSSSEKRRVIHRAYSLSRARYSWKLNAAWIAPHSAFCARCDLHNTTTTTRKQHEGIKLTMMFMKLLVVSVKNWGVKGARWKNYEQQERLKEQWVKKKYECIHARLIY